MSSPMYSLKNGKKPPLLPGRRGAPFKQVNREQTDEQEMISSIACNHQGSKPGRQRIRENTNASKAPNDQELLSAVMQRLAMAEQNLKSSHEIIKEKDKRIKILDEKCKIMEKARGYGDEKFLELERKCQHLQNQVHDMENFLEDYGMSWVGTNVSDDENIQQDGDHAEENMIDRSDHLMSSRNSVWNPITSVATSPKPFRVNFDLIAKNIEELNAIAGEGEHVISHTTRGARLKIREPVPLVLYANGIFMFNGPFRPYHDLETQLCVQDLMDGYFPSELQSKYPNGVPFLLKDMRGTMFRDKRQEKFFTGAGNQLVTESQEISEASVVRKDKSSDTNGLEETSLPPASQRQTVDQFLNRLPASVIKAGKIVDVRSDLEETLKGGKKTKDSVVFVDTEKNEITERPSPAENEANTKSSQGTTTLRIKSEKGDKTYVFKMKYTNTIADVRRHIDKLRLSKAANYQLKTAFPNRTYDRLNSTLEECELVPNATLHLLVTKR